MNKNRWSIISKIFPGRTQHAVKNRFLAVMGKEMSLSRSAIRNLLKKQNNEQLICKVLSKLRSSCQVEKFHEMKDLTSGSFKRSQQQMGMESPCLTGKRAKFNPEHEENLINIENQSLKLTHYDSTPKMENNENYNLIDILADKFNFWKEDEEVLEKKSLFFEETYPIFKVDDFLS